MGRKRKRTRRKRTGKAKDPKMDPSKMGAHIGRFRKGTRTTRKRTGRRRLVDLEVAA